jgi:hypothetical protein
MAWTVNTGVVQDTDGWYYQIVKEYGALSEAQKENNALLFYRYFQQKMTLAAIAGILGNIERESHLNPGQIEKDSQYNVGWTDLQRGHGLIQWTDRDNPNSNPLVSWKDGSTNNKWASGAFQCYRIECEGAGKEGAGGTFYKSKKYPQYNYSWDEFCQLTDYEEATKAYLHERERAGVDALQERLDNAKKWYEFLTKRTSVTVNKTPDYDSSYIYGIHKGKLTINNRDHMLTPHLPLYLFTPNRSYTNSVGQEYAYSDKTVELLETIILTYPDGINQEEPILATSTYRPNNTSSMHGVGGAIDVLFYDKNKSIIDSRYIAVAAEIAGFTGIAPLHYTGKTTDRANVIHLDTRGDFVSNGGNYKSTRWRGYEFDLKDSYGAPGTDGTYETTGNLPTGQTHKDFYGITDDDFLAVLGAPFGINIAPQLPPPPAVLNLKNTAVYTEVADFSVEISGQDISSLYYTIDGENVALEIATGTVMFSIENLVPNTTYELTVTAINPGGTTTCPAISFTTLQDYPDPVKSIKILSTTSKNVETETFNIIIEEPDRWGYWRRIGNNYGYRLFPIENCILLTPSDKKVQNSIKIIPKNLGISHNTNFQIGISTWVEDNSSEKVFALPGEEFPVGSNSIFLKDLSEISDTWFLLENNKISKIQPYMKAGILNSFKPLNIFKT